MRENFKITQSWQNSYVGMRTRDLEFKVNDLVCCKISPMKGVIRFVKKGNLVPLCRPISYIVACE